MNWDEVKGMWRQVKGQAQQRWGKLTNDDLDVIEGQQEELIGKLQQRYGYTKEQARKEADTFLRNLESGPERRRAGNE